MKKRTLTALAMAASVAVVLAGCGSGGAADGSSDSGGASGASNPSSDSGGASKADIVIGSVNTKSGPATFPEASEAAEAVFKKFNDDGGLDGQKIKYISQDDEADLSKATDEARKIVDDNKAVMMVGGASLIECQANAAYYEAKGILSMPGVGVDRSCFETPNIAAANVGPFNDTTLTLLYGSEILGLDNICALLEIAGNTLPAYEAAIQRWSDATGKKMLYVDATVPYGDSDYTPYLVKARDQGCTAIVNNPVEPDSIAMLKNAHAMGWDDVTWLELTSVYSTNYAESVSDVGNGIYLPAEFYPFTDKNAETKEWRDLMEANSIDLTSFSEGGFLAATYFIEVLQKMHADGQDITRENVTKAFHALDGDNALHSPMSGTPYAFGTAAKHDVHTCGWPVQLMNGTNKWEHAEKGGDKWLCITDYEK